MSFLQETVSSSAALCARSVYCHAVVAIVVIIPPLHRDGGTARTAIQVHAVNLIEIRIGERWQPISNQS